VTDRPTDHATRSVTIDRIGASTCIRSTAMQPNNNSKKKFISINNYIKLPYFKSGNKFGVITINKLLVIERE